MSGAAPAFARPTGHRLAILRILTGEGDYGMTAPELDAKLLDLARNYPKAPSNKLRRLNIVDLCAELDRLEDDGLTIRPEGIDRRGWAANRSTAKGRRALPR